MIRRSARGVRWLATSVSGIFLLADVANVGATGFKPAQNVTFALVVLALSVRPWFMGVTIAQGELIVRSWFRDYHYSLTDVSRVRHTAYRGGINRWGDSTWYDPTSSWCQMLEIETQDAKRRPFPSTINGPHTIRKVIESIDSKLGLPAGDGRARHR